jgi:CHAD domain-containing protein
MGIEREVKLLASPDFVMPDLGGTALPDQQLKATYYDTPDLRLARWGVSLRYRTGEGAPRWTLKLPSDLGGPGLTRTELEFEGPPAAVPPAVCGLVTAYVRTSELVRVARLETRRQLAELRDELGVVRAIVSDDDVKVYDGRRLTSQFREIEVEAVAGGADVLEAAAARLEAAGAVAGQQLSKVARALGPAAALAPHELPAATLTRNATAGEVVQAAIAGSVRKLLKHDPGVRLGDDIEQVHQARVATRRLRSDLRTFASLVDDAWAKGLRSELSWLADLLGAVRDLDVLSERLAAQVQDLPVADQRGGVALLARLHSERADARAALIVAMESDQYVALLETLIAAANAPMLTAEAAQPARPVLAALVQDAYKRVKKAVHAVTTPPVDADLHNVRIRAKRARYAADAAVPVWGKPARKLASAIAGVQTVLGDLQDAVVTEEWLRRSGRASVNPAFVAGELVVMQTTAMASSRAAFPAAWTKASAPKLRTWLR